MVHNMVSPINPLYLDPDNSAQLILCCEYGLPLDIAVMAMVGITAPATLAGALAQTLAEELGTITAIQAICPGHPVAFFIDPMVGNMRSGEALAGAPESALLLSAICQLGTELFGLPTEAIGFNSDGFSSAQTMFHKAQNLAFQVLSGGKLVVGAGSVESIMALSAAQLVLDDEFIAIARRWLRGITVDEVTLALDVVARVGPRGDYLSDEHTVDAIHAGELLDLKLAERESRRQVWELGGSKTLESRAAAKAVEILDSHVVPPLPDEVLRDIAGIMKQADAELAGE
jgi:trimethylamine--corrinoid protein Co-methyltransferase